MEEYKEINIGDIFYSVCGDECIATIQNIENDDIFYTTNFQKTKGLIDLPKENFMANWKREKQKPLLNPPVVEIDFNFLNKMTDLEKLQAADKLIDRSFIKVDELIDDIEEGDNAIIMDTRQISREKKPRFYDKGKCPTLNATMHKDIYKVYR